MIIKVTSKNEFINNKQRLLISFSKERFNLFYIDTVRVTILKLTGLDNTVLCNKPTDCKKINSFLHRYM